MKFSNVSYRLSRMLSGFFFLTFTSFMMALTGIASSLASLLFCVKVAFFKMFVNFSGKVRIF